MSNEFTELRTFAEHVAKELGAGWTVEPSENVDRWPALVRTDGSALWFNRKGYGKDANRVYVHGRWPMNPVTGQIQAPYFSEYSDNGPSAPQITFNADRGAQAAARAIRSRFLPVYQPLFDKMAAQVADNVRHQSSQRALADRVAPLVGGTVTKDRDGQSAVRVPYNAGAVQNVDLNHDGTVTLKIRVTEAQLQQLQPVLATFENVDETA